MFPDIKYAHFTVPHSGTRYINYAVEKALNTNLYQISNLRAYENTHNREGVSTSFMFCHIGPRWEEFVEMVAEQPHIKTWITVRSPIHTWGTHYGHIMDHMQESPRAVYEQLGQMREQYMALMNVYDKVGYIHRVDIDPLENLGNYLGIKLEEHDNRYSKSTPMKQALRERDLDKMEELCEGTEFYKAFRDYTTPDIKEFFEDLGYDIWWYNGQRNAT